MLGESQGETATELQAPSSSAVSYSQSPESLQYLATDARIARTAYQFRYVGVNSQSDKATWVGQKSIGSFTAGGA